MCVNKLDMGQGTETENLQKLTTTMCSGQGSLHVPKEVSLFLKIWTWFGLLNEGFSFTSRYLFFMPKSNITFNFEKTCGMSVFSQRETIISFSKGGESYSIKSLYKTSKIGA